MTDSTRRDALPTRFTDRLLASGSDRSPDRRNGAGGPPNGPNGNNQNGGDRNGPGGKPTAPPPSMQRSLFSLFAILSLVALGVLAFNETRPKARELDSWATFQRLVQPVPKITDLANLNIDLPPLPVSSVEAKGRPTIKWKEKPSDPVPVEERAREAARPRAIELRSNILQKLSTEAGVDPRFVIDSIRSMVQDVLKADFTAEPKGAAEDAVHPAWVGRALAQLLQESDTRSELERRLAPLDVQLLVWQLQGIDAEKVLSQAYSERAEQVKTALHGEWRSFNELELSSALHSIVKTDMASLPGFSREAFALQLGKALSPEAPPLSQEASLKEWRSLTEPQRLAVQGFVWNTTGIDDQGRVGHIQIRDQALETRGGKTTVIKGSPVQITDQRLVFYVAPNVIGLTEFADPRSTPQSLPYYVEIVPNKLDYYMEALDKANVPWAVDIGNMYWPSILLSWFPLLLIVILMWLLIARSVRGAGGGPGGMLGSFGKSRHRMQSKDSVQVTFNDVAGVDEAKEEVTEIVEFLKNPKRFAKLGGRIPRGVLLAGPPGCGKTLLAKAIAGEADVPFFSISGSDFVEMFVGVGASRVRDLFKQAKDNSPCIIFLDEIDAVGRRRGGGFTTGGHDEREQTLNAILVEMDGFEANDQVIVIAATNRVDVLDPALTRPGRFDRSVTVSLPDIVGRKQILSVHMKKVKAGPDVDLERVARGTPMFSGADLAAVINEAAIIATMAGKDYVETSDLEEARDKIRFGRAQKSRKIEQQERVATAYHEAGHTVIQALLTDADPLHKVTIIPRGQAMGATFSLPEKDRYGYSRKYVLATMRVLCGGRIAEQRKTGDISSGASMDIRMATGFARAMILDWGMSDRLGFVNYSGTDTRESFIPEKDYSPDTAKVIDDEIRRIIDEAYTDAEQLIDAHWEKVVAIAEALLKYETLQRDDVDKLMRGERMERPTVADLLAAEAAARPPKPVVPAPPRPEPDLGGGAMPSPA
jgi:cell division protease FtsH